MQLRLLFTFTSAAVIFSSGCACPHRSAVTEHTVELYGGRDDGLLAREVWRDAEGGGGFFLFADPTVQNMTAFHTNQTALGGASMFSAGALSSIVDTNLAPAIGAAGTAAGRVIGAAVK